MKIYRFSSFFIIIQFIFLSSAKAGDIIINKNESPGESIAETKKIKFDTKFLTGFNKDIDLSWLEDGNAIVKPGDYIVRIYVNNKKLKSYKVKFERNKNDKNLIEPCIPSEVLSQINFNKNMFPENWLEQQCLNIKEKINGAEAIYEADDETLHISIPQIYLSATPDGFIDPSRWDHGINALSLNYTLSGSNMVGKTSDYALYYGNLQTLLRLGAWRFTTIESVSGGSQQPGKINHLQAYAQRAIATGLSELSVGDFDTRGYYFDTTSLRGVSLQTDERMLPWTVKGYAPQIRGIANSNAVVTIKQNNNIIYEQNVPAGEFNITNLNAMGFGSDLEVSIRESNGTVRVFTVPNSIAPQLIRKGYFNYSLAAGKVRSFDREDSPEVIEAGVRYGLSNFITIYGGSQNTLDSAYLALKAGIAFNTGIGGISTEVSQSRLRSDFDNNRKGNKDNNLYRLKYAKSFSETGTMLNLSFQHNPGGNYYSLNNYLSLIAAKKNGYENYLSDRNRLEVSLSQRLPENYGEIVLTGWWENKSFSEQQATRSSYIFGYNNSYSYVNYNININKSYTPAGKEDTTIFFNASFPFGRRSNYTSPTLLTSLSYNSDESRVRAAVNGNHEGENYNSSFNSYFSQSSRSGSDFGVTVGHSGSAMQKSISYSQRADSYSLAGNLAGALLIYGDGIEFASQLGDTVALINAPGGEGARVMGSNFGRINKKGYGIVPYLSPYEENRLQLDTKGAQLGFETDDDGTIIIPSAGAVIKTKYNNRQVYNNSILGRIKDASDNYLPFGARLYDEENNLLGTVGQAGIVIVSLPDSYQLVKAKWKDGKEKSCVVQPWEIKKQVNKNTVTETFFCR